MSSRKEGGLFLVRSLVTSAKTTNKSINTSFSLKFKNMSYGFESEKKTVHISNQNGYQDGVFFKLFSNSFITRC